eukprot:EC796012.1.p3 GENE.EC796012.1~~EC796012.1.p3  ORF type:complete len:58 (+),score=3.81 EC796012.1:102-275(+)
MARSTEPVCGIRRQRAGCLASGYKLHVHRNLFSIFTTLTRVPAHVQRQVTAASAGAR